MREMVETVGAKWNDVEGGEIPDGDSEIPFEFLLKSARSLLKSATSLFKVSGASF